MGLWREQVVKRLMRSGQWPTTRKNHLKFHGYCEVCGRKDSLEVHHIKPFVDNPSLENDPTNLITLCDGATSCHQVFGHLGDWKSYNPDIETDAAEWHIKFKERPE